MADRVERLLEKYLDLAREHGVEVRTILQQSKFLGVSSGFLSQLRNGKAKLSPEVIEKIASAVSSTGVAAKDDVKNELSSARETEIENRAGQSTAPAEDLFTSVEKFFSRVSNRDSLVCVDYRDFPQTTKDGPYPILATAAARAVAHGCSFAMFQPFGTVEELDEKLIKAVRRGHPEGYTYLHGLARKVREVYKEIKAEAEALLTADGRKEECRIVLYEAKAAPTIAACGISSRMLYASYVEGNPVRRHERVYQWVAGEGDRDHFIERDKSSVGLGAVVGVGAITQQFNPITLCWSAEKGLPRTNDELKREFGRCKLDEELVWKVWEGEES